MRDLRVEAVADALATEPTRTGVRDLAVRYDFASRDTLARAFRQRFGVTVDEFRSARGIEAR